MKKKTLSKRLAENLAYFVNDVSRRCINEMGRCKYHGKTLDIKTKGCFIGSLLPSKIRLRLDELGDGDVDWIIKRARRGEVKLPKLITDNSTVMLGFQNLHDNATCWDTDGLNEKGVRRLKRIIECNSEKLNITDFAQFL